MPNTLSEYEQLYLNLGSALTQWQQVEIGLFDVFHKVTSCPNRHVASAVFFAVISFEGKLAMTHAAATIALEATPHEKDWIALAKRVGNSQTLRNHLAHFQLSRESTRNPKAKYKLRLTPNFYDAMQAIRYSESEPPKYDLQQVENFRKQFTALAEDLTAFAERLPQH